MTEYEIADLAISNTALIQTQLLLIQGSSSQIISNLTLFYSLVFGYLLVAYVIGGQLTRTQVSILSTLYLVAAAYNRISGYSIFSGMLHTFDGLEELTGTAIPRFTATEDFLMLVTVFVVLSILGSLYFMWSVRHPREE
jgi:hypothetical protein